MTAFFTNLVFLNPWLLAALAGLPVLYILLRIMPPAPQRIFLPSARFLAGLVPAQQTPSHTPWPILLLRLLIAALVILAFAQPVMNPSSALPGSGKVRLVLENGWESAYRWDDMIREADEVLSTAAREQREVEIITTAPPETRGPQSAAEAQAVLKGLTPLPYPADYKTLNTFLTDDDAYTFWFSHGVGGRGFAYPQSDFKLYAPQPEHLPILIKPGKAKDGIAASLIAPDTIAKDLPITLQVLGENGRVLGLQDTTISEDISIDIPAALRSEARQIKIANRPGAGSVLILGDQFARKSVGLVTPDEDSKPFIEASYYLTRALEPFADMTTGTLAQVLASAPSMIILPDIGAIPPSMLNTLEDWVQNGGLLLRFAGPAMAEGQNALIPVPLRRGQRSLGGTLAWDTPPKLSEFTEGSPLAGLEIREEITVKEQLLAQPIPDLPQKTWASLDDGTPLITADTLGDGLLVMVHTTASPDWSDLPLSGMFVHILERLVKLAGAPQTALQETAKTLQPVWVLDGYGRRTKPDGSVGTIAVAEFANTKPSTDHPPGLYGAGAITEALNLGTGIDRLEPLPDLPSRGTSQFYGETYETNLMPVLLLMAVILFLLDWLIMLALSLRFQLRWVGAAAMLLLLLPTPAMANPQYADGLYLAYFKSPDPSVNALTQQGLEGLATALTRRTSAEPDGVAALNPETDDLNFFPLIYWPITPGQPAPSAQAVANIQSYLDLGGTLLIDTRDGAQRLEGLQNTIGALNIPALTPIPKDHVIGKSFYLLDRFPGRFTDATIWVESTSAGGRDGVSSVILGSHDWAGAWAQSQGKYYRSGGHSRQYELATRFGVNVMMYALTGNYKADQVHVEHILERLGQ